LSSLPVAACLGPVLRDALLCQWNTFALAEVVI
jgi:hypothetical protein